MPQQADKVKALEAEIVTLKETIKGLEERLVKAEGDEDPDKKKDGKKK